MTLQVQWATEATTLDGGDLVTLQTFHILEFDAVMSETHEGRSEITQRAVERGAPISDHKRALNRLLTLEGFVTNTPLDAPPPSGYGLTTVTTTIGKTGAQVRVFSAEFDRVRDVWDTLERLRMEATPVGISTRWRDYEDVQILAVTLPRETPEDSAMFSIEISEVRIARTREVDTPRPREPRGAPETDRGAREGEDAERGSALDEVRDAYNARRESGESVTDSAGGAINDVLGFS